MSSLKSTKPAKSSTSTKIVNMSATGANFGALGATGIPTSNTIANNKAKIPPKNNEPVEIIAHLNMAEYTHYVQTRVPIDRPLFEPTPKRIELVEYEPFGSYDIIINLQNQDYVW